MPPVMVGRYFASGSGRTWKCTTSGFVPLPPSLSHGVRSPLGTQRPRPFQPAFAIVDAAFEAFRVEAERIRNPQRHHLVVDERVHAVEQVRRRHRHVRAQARRVVLIDPAVIARLDAFVGAADEAGAGIPMEGPAFGAVIAGGRRAVQRAFALAPVERAEMAAAERHPDDAVAVDVGAARCRSPASARVNTSASAVAGGFDPGFNRTTAPG